jgi:HSP20 family protein
MPNIEISRGKAPAKPAASDPFDALRAEMNRLIDSFDRGMPSLPSLFHRSGTAAFGCDLDVHDDGQTLTIEGDIPGVAENDVKITLSGDVLTISGERSDKREESRANYYVSERSFGAFQRSIRLPETIDDTRIEARFDKGVLKITAPKKPEAVKAERTIEVKAG